MKSFAVSPSIGLPSRSFTVTVWTMRRVLLRKVGWGAACDKDAEGAKDAERKGAEAAEAARTAAITQPPKPLRLCALRLCVLCFLCVLVMPSVPEPSSHL